MVRDVLLPLLGREVIYVSPAPVTDAHVMPIRAAHTVNRRPELRRDAVAVRAEVLQLCAGMLLGCWRRHLNATEHTQSDISSSCAPSPHLQRTQPSLAAAQGGPHLDALPSAPVDDRYSPINRAYSDRVAIHGQRQTGGPVSQLDRARRKSCRAEPCHVTTSLPVSVRNHAVANHSEVTAQDGAHTDLASGTPGGSTWRIQANVEPCYVDVPLC